MSGFLKKIGLEILAVVILGLAFFFFYVVKTPQYSLYLIHKAVQSHDTVSFEQHVDLDTIYSKGIDDLIASGLKGKKTIVFRQYNKTGETNGGQSSERRHTGVCHAGKAEG